MRLNKPIGLLRDVFPADTVTRLASGFVNPDPRLWPINQGKYYADLGYLCMREDEKLFLDAYLLARYAPLEPFGVLRHEEYFVDWDGTRAGGINTPLMEPDYVTKMQLWSVSGNKIIDTYREFARTAVCPPIKGMVSPKLNEVLAPSKATRLVVCLPGWFHYLEKRFFGPILEWHRTHPWEGAIRVGTSIEGDTHRIFKRHASSTEVFECDITGLEFCYNQDYWDMLCRLRQRQSKHPQHIKALYDAARHAKLVFPDGTVCDETVAEKSGGQNTLCDNGIATEITFRRAHYNYCADRKLPYNAEDMRLDIMGDNAMVSFYGPLAGKNIMFVFQVYFRLWGFHLKAKAARGNGAWGLVWCGWTKDGPGQWIRFEKPDKMLAKACFQSRTVEVAVQQLQACYRLLYNTPVLAEVKHAIKRVESLYKVSIKLPNWGHIQLSLAEFIPQCARFPDFYSHNDPAGHPVHNGAQAPPDKGSAMTKTKKVIIKTKVKKERPKVEVIKVRPKKRVAKKKAKKHAKGGGASMTLALSAMEDQDCMMSVQQMLNADAVYHKFVEASTEAKVRFMVGPPAGNELNTVNWVTATRLVLSTYQWSAGTEQSLRVWAAPSPNSHVTYGTGYDAAGAVTSTFTMNVQGYANLAAQYESVSCSGLLMVIKSITPELNKGGLVTLTNYQNVGAASANVIALTRGQIYNMDCYQWPPNSVEKARIPFVSNSWNDDFVERAPTAGYANGDGCVLIEVASPAGVAETYEITVYACWAGVPLANIYSAEASSGMAKPTPSCVSEPKVRLMISNALGKLPLYSTARCVARDGVTDPRAWLMDTYDKGKSAYDSFSSAWSGKGGATGVVTSVYRGVQALGGVVSNLFSLFDDEERLCRILLSMDDKALRLLRDYLRTHDLPDRKQLEAIVTHKWWTRKNAPPLPPPKVTLYEEKSFDLVEPPSPAASVTRRSTSVPARR